VLGITGEGGDLVGNHAWREAVTDTQIKLLRSVIQSCRSLENTHYCVLPLPEFAKLEQIYLEVTGKDAQFEAFEAAMAGFPKRRADENV